MMELSEHYGWTFDDPDEFLDCLSEAVDEYEDNELYELLAQSLSEEEKEDISGDALKRGAIKSAAAYAGATVGERAAGAIWDKLGKKNKKKVRKRLLKAVGLGKKRRKAILKGVQSLKPHAAGVGAAAVGIGAAALAKRALAKRKKAKEQKSS